MDLKDISDLIQIRNYVMLAINNYNLPKETGSTLNGMLILIDKQITNRLLSDEFKQFIGFENVTKAIKEAREINNIKSGMKPGTDAVTISGGKTHVIKPQY